MIRSAPIFVRERLPSIERVRRASREATLIALTFKTLVSLIVFWTELFAQHGMTGEPGARVIGYGLNAIVVLFLVWVASTAASLVTEVEH